MSSSVQTIKPKVFVGLSGGVDSAVAALLLLEQGYDVTGVFMKNWSGEEFGIQADCPWEEDQAMAEAVAAHLGVPFRSYNFEKEYRSQVVEYFFREYAAGRTPNPDVMCNKEIKFAVFLERALAEGADFIATGHYAHVEHAADGRATLVRAADTNKDQTYFLHALSQEQLAHALFPLGRLTKPEVRQLAAAAGLPNFARPDSQGICFIGEIDVQQFLRSHISTKPGPIVDVDSGATVGEHSGVYFYTIGQREGLGIGGQGRPYFVTSKDVATNTLFVAHGHDHPALNLRRVALEPLHFISGAAPTTKKLAAMARYRQVPQPGTLDRARGEFVFDNPVRAIAPGQSLVLFDGDVCVGGAVIAAAS